MRIEKWSELSTGQKVRVIGLPVFILAFVAARLLAVAEGSSFVGDTTAGVISFVLMVAFFVWWAVSLLRGE
jgi:H+/gluconate symporter-like permease